MLELGLTGKVAIVTGGSAGLGRAAAMKLAREGARVSICARRKEVLERTAGEIKQAGGDVLAILRGASSPMGAKDVARILFSSSQPTDAEIEKARRRCERLVGRGLGVAMRQGRDDHGRPQPVLYAAAARVP